MEVVAMLKQLDKLEPNLRLYSREPALLAVHTAL